MDIWSEHARDLWMSKKLILILGDQLSENISSLTDYDKDNDIILMCEVWDEATYVKHHKKKIAFIFSAMRHFAELLISKGFHVNYIKLDNPDNSGSFTGEVRRAIETFRPERIIITFPGEYRVLKDIKEWQNLFDLTVEIRPDDRFLCSPDEFSKWADNKKALRMEFFYREMRRKYNILLENNKPIGGEWNYDSENRKFPTAESLFIPKIYITEPDTITKDVIKLVEERFPDHFGDIHPFYFAVTREDALHVLDKFILERLKNFGDYQDAMVEGQPWMYHSHISFYLNCGLLDPLEVIQCAEKSYMDGLAPLNAVEGFIRQILGWREYVRGIYWLKMPAYSDHNFLDAHRELPAFYWGAPTKMNCVKQCVKETKENAYAHHIQRLMVLGNFALIAGIDPKEVNEWFLIVYADAYEWVELPNVTGMILFADGGLLGSKPYASTGAYINKMSDYCNRCSYSVTTKTGAKACPFNYLYWDFMIRNEAKLKGNPRLGFTYKNLASMPDHQRQTIISDAQNFLDEIDRVQ
jgi:deoxyribodipyrimidine photolyase-related protein